MSLVMGTELNLSKISIELAAVDEAKPVVG